MTCIRVRSCLVPLITWRHRVRRRLQLRITYAPKRQSNVPVTKQVSQSVEQAFLVELGRVRGVSRDVVDAPLSIQVHRRHALQQLSAYAMRLLTFIRA